MPENGAPVFFSVGQDIYRVRFPALLEGFDGAVINGAPDGRFDSDRRDYHITGYSLGSVKYDIKVSEFGSDLLPSRIEAWFTAGGKPADIPPELKDSLGRRNVDASGGRTLLYINGRGI